MENFVISQQQVKFKAAILSLCLLAYFAELAALPVSPTVAFGKMCCAGKMKMTGHHGCPKSTKSSNSPAKDCNSCKDCLNCPLCYTIVLTGLAAAEKNTILLSKVYPAYHSNYSFEYYSAAWKPPNIA
jgi:hypothetical protein